MDDPDDELARRDALQHLLAERFLPDIFDELLCNFEVDVRIEQNTADLPKCFRNIHFGDFPLPAELLQHTFKLPAQLFKHR